MSPVDAVARYVVAKTLERELDDMERRLTALRKELTCRR